MTSSKILVVEDELITAMDIKNILEGFGYSVPATVASGEEAIEKVEEFSPDLVLMDIMLEGDMDGIQTAEQIHAHSNIPVVYLTAYADNDTLHRAKITGPFGYLLKPFEEKELHTIIEIALYKHKMENKLIESEEKYSTLVEKGNDGIIIIQDSVLKYVNKKMLDMTKFSFDEANELPFVNFVSPDHIDLVKDRYEKRIRGEAIQPNYEIEILTKDGKYIPVEINESYIQYKGKPAEMAIIRDITESKKATAALMRSEQKFRDLTENIAEMIYSANHKTFENTYCNKAVENIFGYSVDEWLSDPCLWEKSIYPEDVERVFSAYGEMQTSLENRVLEYRIRRKDGELRWVENHVTWLIEKETGVVSISGILHDITDHKNAELAIMNAKIAAESANKSKSEFIANMSHELRTPLNSIIGFSDIIHSESYGPLNENQKRYAFNILKSGKHLLDIINGILDLSKFEAGIMEIKREEFLINDVIKETNHTMLPLCMGKNIDISFVTIQPTYNQSCMTNLYTKRLEAQTIVGINGIPAIAFRIASITGI
ncbi:hybrid sensor histidine kinase/response regulator [Methanococcoides burtonii]|uniref:hybrid sensor histidine kinase/response regulator n=1 Tax=Methanococcoides burtonii TaxID=29291 RepID=UPI00003995FC|nr:PAS domain S-box protein [Methanococcoides burtonii]